MDFTRRHWLAASLAVTAQIAAAQQHAHQAAASAARLETLDPASAKEIEALAAQIMPSDDSPGAREAGVIYFIDRALSTFDADKKDAYRQGMEDVQAARKKLFPTSTSVAALAPQQQIELLRTIETTEFFELLRTHTILGFLGDPSYGGNRDQVGWKHIEFEPAMHYQLPFGYYDAQAAKEKK